MIRLPVSSSRSRVKEGFDASLDTKRIGAGAVWSAGIEREIDTRQVTIALLSPAASEQKLRRGHISQYDMAADCAELGDKSRALNLLERAFGECDVGLIYLQVDEEFDSIRSDPRFQALLRRMNFPQ